MVSRKKLLTSAIALGTAAALTLGGTFAWQSISQRALNEASDIVNPGGRLHDDFDGTNKDVYVENFAEDDIFARVRLLEYFEIIMNYGVEGAETVDVLMGTRGAEVDNGDGTKTVERDGSVFKFDGRVNDDGTVNAGAKDADSESFWKWTVGGSTVFMPTFNVNKDSLVADVNGYYKYPGQITSQDIKDGQYTEMATYEVDAEKKGWAIYDGDTNNIDELSNAAQVADIIEKGTAADSYVNFTDPDHDIDYYIKLVEETHKAKSTGTTKGLISMAEWLELLGSDEYDADTHGGYWVYDTDGWVYWSAPIKAGEATGLLLDGIGLTQVMDDTWYYSIDVEGQFVTANDVGKGNGEGFYHEEKEKPSENAEKLLAAIGVEMGIADGDSGQTPDEDEDDTQQVSALSIALYDDQGTAVEGSTIKSNATYDIVGTLSLDDDSIVVYDSRTTGNALSNRISGTATVSVDAYVKGDDYNTIVDGRLKTGDTDSFSGEKITDGIYKDLTVVLNASGVKVYENEDKTGDPIKECEDETFSWNYFPEGMERYDIPDEARIDNRQVFQGKNSGVIAEYLVDGNGAKISNLAGMTITVKGTSEDGVASEVKSGTKVEYVSGTGFVLTVDPAEDCDGVRVTYSDGNGKCEQTTWITYVPTLYIGEQKLYTISYPDWNEGVSITSKEDEAVSYTLKLVDYYGNEVSGVTFGIPEWFETLLETGTKIEGNTLTLAAGEDYPSAEIDAAYRDGAYAREYSYDLPVTMQAAEPAAITVTNGGVELSRNAEGNYVFYPTALSSVTMSCNKDFDHWNVIDGNYWGGFTVNGNDIVFSKAADNDKGYTIVIQAIDAEGENVASEWLMLYPEGNIQ